jgi:hypothetical protein
MEMILPETGRQELTVRKPKITFAILLLFLLVAAVNATNTDTRPTSPPRVFVDVGACPFECCTYREWIVEAKTTLLDKPNGKQVVKILAKGDGVTGLTGEVISAPIPVKADRDIPDTPIKAGDIFYVLHYDGEGYWKVWLRAKIAYVHDSVVKIPHPKAEWWVKIRDSDGNVGWALSHGNFAHQDSCE